MNAEYWIDVIGYEGLYKVSNTGKVKSLNYRKTGKEQILKQYKDKDGYLKCTLWKNGYRQYKAHRIVCCSFNNVSLNTNLTVNHKDANKENNQIDNLELCTIQDNINHSVQNRLRTPVRGDAIGVSKLSSDIVIEIRKQLDNGVLHRELAAKYKVSKATISSINLRKTWNHI